MKCFLPIVLVLAITVAVQSSSEPQDPCQALAHFNENMATALCRLSCLFNQCNSGKCVKESEKYSCECGNCKLNTTTEAPAPTTTQLPETTVA